MATLWDYLPERHFWLSQQASENVQLSEWDIANGYLCSLAVSFLQTGPRFLPKEPSPSSGLRGHGVVPSAADGQAGASDSARPEPEPQGVLEG